MLVMFWPHQHRWREILLYTNGRQRLNVLLRHLAKLHAKRETKSVRDFHIGKFLVAAAIFVAIGFHYASRALFYTQVQATIVETKVQCFIKEGSKEFHAEGSNDLAFMDCNTARATAVANGFSEAAAQEGTIYTLSWKSPVDNSVHTAQKYATGVGGQIVVGKTRKAYASKSDTNSVQWN